MTMNNSDISETAEILAELERACFPNDFWAASSIRSTLMRGDALYHIEYGGDGRAVGYCIGAASCGEAELYRIGVLPERRREGIGKCVLSEFLKMCPADTERFFLEVRESNAPGVALYVSGGFKAVAKRRGYYGSEDAVIMERCRKGDVFDFSNRP